MSCKDDLGHICDYKVKLQLYSIASPGVSEFAALHSAQRVYGRYGIAMEFVTGQSLGLTPPQRTALRVVDGSCDWTLVSDDQRMLHSLGSGYGTDDKTIRVYFINQIRQADGSALNGCAGYNPGRPGVNIAAIGSQWTFAHEIAHVLLGASFRPVHETRDRGNLMYTPTNDIISNPPVLSPDQLRAIKVSPYCTRC